MTDDEKAVRAATSRFYDAIEQMMTGKGLGAMEEAWHHVPHATSGHPSGDWAEGWDEVWATWQVFASFGRENHSGSEVRDIRVHVRGDMACVTSMFVAAPVFGSDKLSCTNVLERIDGAWKIIHHHADKSPGLAAALEKLITGG